MRIRVDFRTVLRLAACFAAMLVTTPLRSDVVKLKSGGAVQGTVSAVPGGGGKTIAVKTATGATIELDRNLVQIVKCQTNRQANKSKLRLAPEESAWFPKVRKLVSRWFGADPQQSRRARDELLKIKDPDALPALNHYLAGNPEEAARRLYVTILGHIPGMKTTYHLVAMALSDPSADVRENSRKAIGRDRADEARPLFIQALRSRNPDLVSLAAKGIAEIGDPHGDSIPYLIEKVSLQTKTIMQTGTQMHVECGFNIVPPPTRAISLPQDNPVVLDTLVKLTDHVYPGYGTDVVRWRRWWATEKTNRNDQKRSSEVSPDKPRRPRVERRSVARADQDPAQQRPTDDPPDLSSDRQSPRSSKD